MAAGSQDGADQFRPRGPELKHKLQGLIRRLEPKWLRNSSGSSPRDRRQKGAIGCQVNDEAIIPCRLDPSHQCFGRGDQTRAKNRHCAIDNPSKRPEAIAFGQKLATLIEVWAEELLATP
eukprot:4573859-Amphidinium_carterae.1